MGVRWSHCFLFAYIFYFNSINNLRINLTRRAMTFVLLVIMVYEFTLSSLHIKLCFFSYITLVNIFGETSSFQALFSVWKYSIIFASKPIPSPVSVKSTFIHLFAQNRILEVIPYSSY